MKRVFSWLVTVALALSLCVPALAAEPVPLWQSYGCTSEAECVELIFGGDQAAYDAAAAEQEAYNDWLASMSDEIAAFDPDAYWASGQCPMAEYYDSKEQFMEDWLLETEEDFRSVMVDEWLSGQWTAWWDAHETDRLRTEMGGTAGETGIILDGAYIAFPTHKPQVADGVTMAPAKELAEAFGGTVRREGGVLVVEAEGVTVRLQPGSAQAEISDAAGSRTADMGGACYESGGAVYVPVRFLAQTLGCDVLWDSRFGAAVLLRRDKLIEKMDSRFTVLNGLISAMALDQGQNYRTAVKLDGALTALDSINGDKTYQLGADMTVLQSGTTVHLTAKFRLEGWEALLQSAYADETTAQAWKSLEDTGLEMIYDGEGGMLYWKLPALELFTYGMYESGTWIAMPTQPVTALESEPSVGAVLYASVLSSYTGPYAWGDPALLCRELDTAADGLAGYIGDGCFEKSAGYQVLHYGEEEYEADLAEIYGEEYVDWANEFEKLELELKVAERSATFRVLMQNRDQTGFGTVFLVDAQGTVSPTRVNMELLLRLKNQFDLSVSYSAVTAATDEAPASAPPEGETVINPYEGYEETAPGADIMPVPELDII